MSKGKKVIVIVVFLVIAFFSGILLYDISASKPIFDENSVVISKSIDSDGNPVDPLEDDILKKLVTIDKSNEAIYISVKSTIQKSIQYRVVLYEGDNYENKIDDTMVKGSKSGYINYHIRDIDNRSNNNYKVDFYNNKGKEEIEVKFRIVDAT